MIVPSPNRAERRLAITSSAMLTIELKMLIAVESEYRVSPMP
jgi:hypothetical protein